MTARIGGNVADIARTATTMTETGAAAGAAGLDAAGFAETVRAEVDHVTTTLRTRFESLAAQLREHLQLSRARLAETDWEGASRLNLDAAEARLHGDVTRVLTDALAWVESFRAQITGQVGAFDEQVRGEFRAITANIDTAYGELAQAARTFAANLEAADRTIAGR